MKEYYIWETACDAPTEEQYRETQQLKQMPLSLEEINQIMKNRKLARTSRDLTKQLEQTIVIASNLSEAIETIKRDTISWASLLFVGTLPLTSKKIDYRDFIEYAPDKECIKVADGVWETHPTQPKSPIKAWGCKQIIIRRIRDCHQGEV